MMNHRSEMMKGFELSKVLESILQVLYSVIESISGTPKRMACRVVHKVEHGHLLQMFRQKHQAPAAEQADELAELPDKQVSQSLTTSATLPSSSTV